MAAPAALPATPDLASPIHSHPELSRGSESRRGQDGEREGGRERERERETKCEIRRAAENTNRRGEAALWQLLVTASSPEFLALRGRQEAQTFLRAFRS